jgi:putative solute:sodium symporter small subunit
MADRPSAQGGAHGYWVQTRRLTAVLLLAWFVVTFVGTYFARELRYSFLGWPFSFYMAAQGSLIVYLLIVYVYARAQRRRDLAFGVAEADGEADVAANAAIDGQ